MAGFKNPLSEPLKVFLLDLLEHDPEVQAAVRQIVAETLRFGPARTQIDMTVGTAPSEPPAPDAHPSQVGKAHAEHLPWLQRKKE